MPHAAIQLQHLEPGDWQERNGHICRSERPAGKRLTGIDSLGKRGLLAIDDRRENGRRYLAAQQLRDDHAAAVRAPKVAADYEKPMVDGGGGDAPDPVIRSDAAYRKLSRALTAIEEWAGRRAYVVTIYAVLEDAKAGDEIGELRQGLAALADFYRIGE